jgi:hypothetical protein
MVLVGLGRAGKASHGNVARGLAAMHQRQVVLDPSRSRPVAAGNPLGLMDDVLAFGKVIEAMFPEAGETPVHVAEVAQ